MSFKRGGTDGGVVEAVAADVPAAYFDAGFAAVGSESGGGNDGREESGSNCELLHFLFLYANQDHALWVAARPLNGVRACRFNEWIVQNMTIFLPVLILQHTFA